MRWGALGIAGLVLVFFGIELRKHWIAGFDGMSRQDVSFLVILVLLIAGALWLARSISRELQGKSGP